MYLRKYATRRRDREINYDHIHMAIDTERVYEQRQGGGEIFSEKL